MDTPKTVADTFRTMIESGADISADDFISENRKELNNDAIRQILQIEIGQRLVREDAPDLGENFSRYSKYLDKTQANTTHSIQDFFLSDHADGFSLSKLDSGKTFELPNPFGKFELIDHIGSGGMGSVYKARQTDINRIVALKVIRPDIWTGLNEKKRSQLSARMKNEAELCSSIDHPNVVTVYEAGATGECPFLSMQYVKGKTLLQASQDEELTVRKTAETFRSIASGTHTFHQQGAVHRDITPRNIFISDDDCFLGDFGLAKSLVSDQSLTRENSFLGTLTYASPEQIRDSKTVDHRSDIFSLGASMYHALTGRSPFQSESEFETIANVTEREPLSPSKLNSAINADLEAVCLKCLEKNPSQRYQSADDLGSDLENYLAGRPTVARPIGRFGTLVKWFKREPIVGSLLTLIAGLLLAAGIVSAIGWQNAVTMNKNLKLEEERKSKTLETTGQLIVDFTKHVSDGLRDSGNDQLQQSLAQILADYSKQLSQLSENRTMDLSTADVQQTLGQLLLQSGRDTEGAAALQQAKEVFRAMAIDNPAWNVKLQKIHQFLAFLHQRRGEYDLALENINQSLECSKVYFDQPEANQALKVYDESAFLMRKSSILKDAGRIDEALELAGNIDITPADSEFENDVRVISNYGKWMRDIMMLRFQKGLVSDPEKEFKAIYDYWTKATKKFPGNVGIAIQAAGSQMGYASQIKEPTKALMLKEKTVDDFERLSKENPTRIGLKTNLFRAANNLINLRLKGDKADFEAAESLFQRLEPVAKKLLADLPDFLGAKLSYATILSASARTSRLLDDTDEARKRLVRSLALYRAVQEKSPKHRAAAQGVLFVYLSRGELELEAGNIDAAKEAFETSYEHIDGASIYRVPIGVGLAGIADAHEAAGNHEEFINCMKLATEVTRSCDEEIREKTIAALKQDKRYLEADEILQRLEEYVDNDELEKIKVRREELKQLINQLD